MAFDEGLAERIRTVLASHGDVREQKMFGGIAFMVREHMACGVMGPDLLVRLGAEGAGAALGEPGVRVRLHRPADVDGGRGRRGRRPR